LRHPLLLLLDSTYEVGEEGEEEVTAVQDDEVEEEMFAC
jgi:hypothetical protein